MKINDITILKMNQDIAAMEAEMEFENICHMQQKAQDPFDPENSDQYVTKAMQKAMEGQMIFDQESFDFQIRPLNFDDGRRF